MTSLLVLMTLLVTCQALTEEEQQKFYNVTVEEGDTYFKISSNGIPDHAYGPFPSESNPNTVSAQVHKFFVPINPTKASSPGCLNFGSIGVAINGVPIFNPLNAEKQDAVVVEKFDTCGGHPSNSGDYHYHKLPNCLVPDDAEARKDLFLGVALDGFPIYGPYDANGDTVEKDDLDDCNGWERNGQYEYRITSVFPYIMGCYYGNTEAQMPEGDHCFYASEYVPGTNSNGNSAQNNSGANSGPNGSGNGGPSGSGNGTNSSGNGPSGSGNGPNGSGNGSNGSGNGPNGSGNGSNESGNGPNGSGNGPSGSGNGPSGSGNGPNGSGNGPNGSGNGPSGSGNGPSGSGNGPSGSGNGPSGSGNGPNGSGNGPTSSGNGPSGSGNGGPNGSGNGPNGSGNGPNGSGNGRPNGSGNGGPNGSGNGSGGNRGAGNGGHIWNRLGYREQQLKLAELLKAIQDQ